MCIDDNKRRVHLVLQFTAAQTVSVLNIIDSIQLESFEVTGYQITGVNSPGGLPYSPFFIVSLNSTSFHCRPLISNISTCMNSLGVVLPLAGPTTVQQYDTPRVLAERIGSAVATSASQTIQVVVTDILGQPGQFATLTLFCYAVYSSEKPVPMSITSRFADSATYAESAYPRFK